MRRCTRGLCAFSVFLIVLLALCIFGCSKDKEGSKNPPPTISYNLTGKVIGSTGSGISGAAVVIRKNGVKVAEATSGGDGKYVFSNLEIGTYSVYASKSGYTFGQATAQIGENGAMVPDVFLASIASLENRKEEVVSANTIKDTGATVTNEYKPSGSGTTVTHVIEVEIPKGTEVTVGGQVSTGAINMAATPVQLAQTPPPATGELSIASAVLEPTDATFSQPVEVTISLEVPLPAGLSLPVQKFENGQWRQIGTAVTNSSGEAVAQVSEFGQVAVQPKVNIKTQSSSETETVVSTTPINADDKSLEVEVKNEVSFADGLPDGITPEYVRSLIEMQEGIKLGTQTLHIELPTVSETAKPVGVLDANSVEVWVQECKLLKIREVTICTYTLTISVGDTLSYTFVITFTQTLDTMRTECTRSWVDHNQGGVGGV